MLGTCITDMQSLLVSGEDSKRNFIKQSEGLGSVTSQIILFASIHLNLLSVFVFPSFKYI